MKRMQPVILLLAAMTLFLFYKHFFRQNSTQGITRAQTARMLAWTVCDMNENSSKSAEPLIDVDSNLWSSNKPSYMAGSLRYCRQAGDFDVCSYHQENQTDSP